MPIDEATQLARRTESLLDRLTRERQEAVARAADLERLIQRHLRAIRGRISANDLVLDTLEDLARAVTLPPSAPFPPSPGASHGHESPS